MTTPTILHFTLGPVQGFVAQARRPRDLWAGSFLLSWLSGQAMHALVAGRHGEIAFPVVIDDPLFEALDRGATGSRGPGPRIGSLPNRFRAVVNDPDCNAGAICKAAVQDKWVKLADLVWTTFLEPASGEGGPIGGGPEEIWKRQIAGFWDTAWVQGPSDDPAADGAWLDQRKNWRTWWPLVEPGDHCMLMGDWQELSGFVRARERVAQDDYWETVREIISNVIYADPNIGTLELGLTERLCAPALVKRLFPLLFHPRHSEIRKRATEIIGFIPCGSGVTGDGAQANAIRIWRSTAHISATPWLSRVAAQHPGERETYVREIHELIKERDRAGRNPEGIIFSERDGASASLSGDFARIDGRLFYQDAILRKDPRSWGWPLSEPDEAPTRRALAELLGSLQGATKPAVAGRQASQEKASPFFAVLLMDGDNMGALISGPGGERVPDALADFTGFIGNWDPNGDHVTIYAGGDDYLGLFPLSDVIKSALELRQAYLDAFERARITDGGTISGAIIFAPYDEPLSRVLRDGHALLDTIAKERNGRDSLAMRVLKSSGEMATWASKWKAREVWAGPQGIIDLANAMSDDPERSSSFIYKLDRLYGDFYADRPIGPEEIEEMRQIFRAERLVGQTVNAQMKGKAEDYVDQILAACLTTGGGDGAETTAFSDAGAQIARFLADNGFKQAGSGSDGADQAKPADSEVPAS